MLNTAAFERGIEQAAPTERAGMTVAGTYIKSGLLLVVPILGAMFGWSQVQIVGRSSSANSRGLCPHLTGCGTADGGNTLARSFGADHRNSTYDRIVPFNDFISRASTLETGARTKCDEDATSAGDFRFQERR